MSLVLPVLQWPEMDRAMWTALFQEGSPLDEQGPLAHYRATSRATLMSRYRRWLKWLADHEPWTLSLEPAERASVERLRRWLKDLDHTAPITRWSFVEGVMRVLCSAEPDRSWEDQHRLVKALKSAADRHRSRRKEGRVLSSAVLLETGRRLAMEVGANNRRWLDGATGIRDGAMISLLALMPIRLRALSSLRLDESVFITSDRITIALPADLTKSGVPWEADVPEQVLPILRKYVDEARPLLQSRTEERDPHLWLARHGRGLKIGSFLPQIVKHTERMTGVRVSPHLFRDAAATTLARASPAASRLIGPVLAHKTSGTAEKHYIHALTIDAGRDYAALVASRKARHPGGR
ncbi:hypothetical protein KUW09_24815 [Mameliella alba]|nr:hypothetical protein [Antarctobacter heliothermus]MBY6147294.1 hypothetical protein [Mameliella alba]MCA0957350.1 hypothetical protein [Mameliella alba]